MPDRPVTIVDVARHAKVSHSTVSRVLNGFPHVAEATRLRVELAAAELGYVANLNARGLAGGQSGVIGLVVLEITSSYLIEVARGVDHELSAAGFDLMLSTNRERHERERDHVLRLSRGLCDGVILLVPSAPELYVEELLERRYPVVLVDHGATDHASTATMKNRAGAQQAMTHLFELGHRRIGHIGGLASTDAARERRNGWRDFLAARDLPCGPELDVDGNFTREAGRMGAARLLDSNEPPTAVLAPCDIAAVGVLDELRARGLRCPDDLSVVGFDDVHEATLTTPMLTTVRQPMQQVGREAVRLLLSRLEDPTEPIRHVELATELVVRESTGAPSR